MDGRKVGRTEQGVDPGAPDVGSEGSDRIGKGRLMGNHPQDGPVGRPLVLRSGGWGGHRRRVFLVGAQREGAGAAVLLPDEPHYWTSRNARAEAEEIQCTAIRTNY